MASITAAIDLAELLGLRESIDALIKRAFPTGRFTHYMLKPAMLELLAENPGGLKAGEIEHMLTTNGFHTKSANFRANIHSVCLVMLKHSELESDTVGGKRIFKLVATKAASTR